MAHDSSAPTLKDVAERAGVSSTTASMALSGRTGSAHLSQAAISRVHRAAKELGYRGNYHARTLASGRAFTLGLAAGSGPVSLIEHDFFNPIIGGVEAASRARGYDMLVIGGTEMLMPLERALNHLEERRIDALIIVRALYPSVTPELQASRLPIVLLEGFDVPQLPQVTFDAAPGITAALMHLAQLGHRRICWVGPDHGHARSPERARMQLAVLAAREHGLELTPLVMPLAPGVDGLSVTAQAHLALSQVPWPQATAYLCYNDEIALAVSWHLARRGIDIPRQASVIGFDDRYGGLMVPALTTISHSQRRLGEACVSLALDIVDGVLATSPPPRLAVPARLVVRHSTGPCPSPA